MAMKTPTSSSMNPAEDRLVTRQTLSVRWECSLSTVKRLEARGLLRPIKLGDNVLRYRLSDILALEENGEVGRSSDAA